MSLSSSVAGFLAKFVACAGAVVFAESGTRVVAEFLAETSSSPSPSLVPSPSSSPCGHLCRCCRAVAVFVAELVTCAVPALVAELVSWAIAVYFAVSVT